MALPSIVRRRHLLYDEAAVLADPLLVHKIDVFTAAVRAGLDLLLMHDGIDGVIIYHIATEQEGLIKLAVPVSKYGKIL